MEEGSFARAASPLTQRVSKSGDSDMKDNTITIRIGRVLYAEILKAAKDCRLMNGAATNQRMVEQFATECVESVLASRRLGKSA